MDENKQIEGMAKVLYGKYCGNDKCGNCKEPSCVSYIFAEKLYNAGYRKQSDTVREFVEFLQSKINSWYFVEMNGNLPLNTIFAIKSCDKLKIYNEIGELIKQLAKEYGVEVEE